MFFRNKGEKAIRNPPRTRRHHEEVSPPVHMHDGQKDGEARPLLPLPVLCRQAAGGGLRQVHGPAGGNIGVLLQARQCAAA